LLYSYTDNSNGSFASIRFITDKNSTAEFTQPSYSFYDHDAIELFYRSTVNGRLSYTDNVAGFIVIEDELKACPSLDGVGKYIRYQTKPCSGMIYTTVNEVGDMLIGTAEVNVQDENEQHFLEIRKETKENGGKSYSATKPLHYDFTGVENPVPVKYIDEVHEVSGKIVTTRCFYYFNKDKLLYIDITVPGNQAIADNKFYQACMKSIIIKTL
jgi:hypothetical protein